MVEGDGPPRTRPQPTPKFEVCQPGGRTLPAFSLAGRYARAVRYGDDWTYVGIVVTASRSGIALGFASMWSIESDSDDDYFIEQSLELAAEAIAEANSNLTRLCQRH